MFHKLRGWIVDRFGLEPVHRTAIDRAVAKGRWYYGDGASLLLLLGVLVATGSMMALTYSPNLDTAYQSVQYITYKQKLGWFIRGLHYWSAGMMVVMLVWHVFRQVLVAGYKFPREGTWLIGVGLFFAVLVMAQTGYILRWDERGIYALKVVLHMFSRVPWIGDELVIFVQGGMELGERTLSRVFAVHVLLVPLSIAGLVVWHVYLVMFHGVTSRRERREEVETSAEQKKIYEEEATSEEHGESFFPETAVKSGAMAAVVFAIALGLTLLAGPAPLMPEANLVEESFPSEEWWWWWYSALIALLPPSVAPWFVVVFPLAVFVGLALLPFVDRSPKRGMRKRPVAVCFVVVAVAGIFGLSGLRLRSPWTGWPEPAAIPLPEGVGIEGEAELGRQLFARHGCTSCHAVAGVGREVAVDLARLEEDGSLSRDELRDFILQPPDGVSMPAYAGRLTEEELRGLLAYVLVAQTFPRGR